MRATQETASEIWMRSPFAHRKALMLGLPEGDALRDAMRRARGEIPDDGTVYSPPRDPSSGKRERERDPNVKFWVRFQMCAKKCLEVNCRQCGYFWGPDHPHAGQPAVFGIYGV
jgi:hypothetical protein